MIKIQKYKSRIIFRGIQYYIMQLWTHDLLIANKMAKNKFENNYFVMKIGISGIVVGQFSLKLWGISSIFEIMGDQLYI